MAKKKIIDYTSRDFNSIKEDLLQHAKRYYPENYNDFSESSFGSMMLDAVAYVGDVLSFYLDYQVNESFLETALEPSNVRRLAAQRGYKYYGSPSAYGTATFYVLVPAATSGLGPDRNYIPVLKTGTRLQSSSGVIFLLTEDVDFSNVKNEVVAARFDNTTSNPTYYAIRAQGQVKSGHYYVDEFEVGSYERNKRIRVGNNRINSIESVIDSDGNRYYEVDNLSQDVVYVEINNPTSNTDGVPSIIKPFKVPRRFVVLQDDSGTYIQFGFGEDETTTLDNIADPSTVVMEMTGKNYISDRSFDPNKLLNSNKMGVSPSNTTLRVIYGKNNVDSIGVAVDQLNNIVTPEVSFPNRSILSTSIVNTIVGSIEVTNEESITAETTAPTAEEIKVRSYGSTSTQNRAVTKNDYEAMIYMMPKKFGSIKRCSVINDPSSSNRRLSLYVIGEDHRGRLANVNDTVKNNLKTWINKNKVLNDSVDIYDAKVINISMTYTVTIDSKVNKYGIISKINNRLKKVFANKKMYISESLSIPEIYRAINRVPGVIDAKKVKFKVENTGNYSNVRVAVDQLYSSDGASLVPPKNCILEFKFPNTDIKGIVE